MPCSRTQHGLTRVGLEPPTSGSGVRGVGEKSANLVLLSITRNCVDSVERFHLPLGAYDKLRYFILTLPGFSV